MSEESVNVESINQAIQQVAVAARAAAADLAVCSGADRDAALIAMADALTAGTADILAANRADLDAAQAAQAPDAVLDRLRIDEAYVATLSGMLREVAGRPSPLGDATGTVLPSGLEIRQIRVPIGVVGMIYEGRPNVTVDAAALALKSGNAVLLRGSSVAYRSNSMLIEVMRKALAGTAVPVDAIQLVPGTTRDSVRTLMSLRGLVDVLIPRGGKQLIESTVRDAAIPVIETGVGNCHIYIDKDADLAMALNILINAKVQRPSVCNAVETLLVHADIAPVFLPQALAALRERGVTVHGDERVRSYDDSVVAVTEEDWETEYLALDIAAAVVDSTAAAIAHIACYGSGHSETIITDSTSTAHAFATAVDSAAVLVNASSRLVDGTQMGFGTELGISTQKLHVRGPMGLTALTTTKFLLVGTGHVRGAGSSIGGTCEILTFPQP